VPCIQTPSADDRGLRGRQTHHLDGLRRTVGVLIACDGRKKMAGAGVFEVDGLEVEERSLQWRLPYQVVGLAFG
jgi:hypothetical protein